jgi:hypothetical protein
MDKSKKFYNLLKPKLNTLTYQQFVEKYYASEGTFNGLIDTITEKQKKLKLNNFYILKIKEKTVSEFYQSFACGDEKITWAAETYWCKHSPYESDENLDLKKYAGTFLDESNSRVFLVKVDNGKLKITVDGLPPEASKFSQLTLKNTNENEFSIDVSAYLNITAGLIKYTEDLKGFNYDFSIVSGYVTKIDSKPVTPTPTTEPKKDNTSNTDEPKKETPIKSTTLYNKKTDYGANANDVKVIPYVDHSFPFKLKERHELIGDLSSRLFGTRASDIYTQVLQNYLTSYSYFGPDNPKKEITKDVWDRGMKTNPIRESVKKVLKEYINRKK